MKLEVLYIRIIWVKNKAQKSQKRQALILSSNITLRNYRSQVTSKPISKNTNPCPNIEMSVYLSQEDYQYNCYNSAVCVSVTIGI